MELSAGCGAEAADMTAPPREPTAQMFIAGTKALAAAEGSFARVVWQAMYDVAPAPSAEPNATDDLVSTLLKLHDRRERHYLGGATGQACGLESYRIVATGNQLACMVDAAAELQRQAREIARWRNVTARADPDDCAAGIKELYGRWKDAEAELHKANIDSANMMAECSDLSVDVEKYRQEIAALRLAVKDDAQWAQENERLTRELDRVKVQLTSEITDALAERDAAIGSVNVLKTKYGECVDERDALRECVKAADAMRRGEDCPMCDSGELRNPAKLHWDSCAFANYDAARAKVKMP